MQPRLHRSAASRPVTLSPAGTQANQSARSSSERLHANSAAYTSSAAACTSADPRLRCVLGGCPGLRPAALALAPAVAFNAMQPAMRIARQIRDAISGQHIAQPASTIRLLVWRDGPGDALAALSRSLRPCHALLQVAFMLVPHPHLIGHGLSIADLLGVHRNLATSPPRTSP